MNTKKYILILIGILCPVYGSVMSQNEHPNIILILADDQGWDGTSVQMDDANILSKSDYYQTPNLEVLASEGMKFSQAYSASPVCSPSRYAILTGLSPARLGMTDILYRNPEVEVNLACPHSEDEIDPDLTTLPQALKDISDANYYCGTFGKWHMGEADPSEAGFDQNDGTNGNGTGNQSGTFLEDPKKIFSITSKGINFMNESVAADRPFYLQLNHYAVHLWPESKEETYIENSDLEQGNHFYRVYGAMTEDLDESVGMLMSHLEELGIADNTYVIYTSDNGSVEYSEHTLISPSASLQQGKTHVWEGGIRVPMIVKGPGIDAGVQSDVNFNGTDIYATVLDLAGYGGDAVNETDSRSIAPELISNSLSSNSTEESAFRVYHFPHYAPKKWGIPQSAIIEGSDKFLIDLWSGRSFLFDISNDPGESIDRSSEEAERKMELYKKLRDYLNSVDASLPTFNPEYLKYNGEVPDLDNDGMADDWEFHNFLTGYFYGGEDIDGDGFTGLVEFQNNSDPLDANDFPEASAIPVLASETLILQDQDGIRLSLPQDAKQVLISDLSGRLIHQIKVADSYNFRVDLDGRTNALYFLRVDRNSGVETQAFIR